MKTYVEFLVRRAWLVLLAVAIATAWIGMGLTKLRAEFNVEASLPKNHPFVTIDREIRKEFGSGMCNITRCCTEVCPEHINITDNGIIPLKERVVDRYFDPIVYLGQKLFGISKRR